MKNHGRVNKYCYVILLTLLYIGMSKGTIAGIVIGGAFGILLLALFLYFVYYRRKKVAQVTLLPVPGASEDQYSQLQHGISF